MHIIHDRVLCERFKAYLLSFIFIVTTDEVHNKINFSCEIVIVEGM